MIAMPRARAPAEPAVPVPLWHRGLRLVAQCLLLVCAGVTLELGWVMVWTLSYRLTHGNGFTHTYLTEQTAVWEKLHDLLVLADTLVPNIEPPQDLDIVVNALMVTFVVVGVGYLAGVVLLDRGAAPGRGGLWLVLGFAAVFQVTLFSMPGLFTTDIFSYVMYGHISAIYELNPYVYPPVYFPGNEMLDWIHPIWHNQTSVYGPLWTDIGWVMARATTGLSSLERVFAYKVLMNGVHLANLGLVWWLLGRFLSGATYRARVTAFTVFAWNPLVLFDVVGNAHNDGLMVTLLLLGLVPLALRLGPAPAALPPSPTPTQRVAIPNAAWLAGLLFVGLSALVKYTTGIVGLFYLVPWVRQLRSWRARILWLGGGAIVMLGITYLLFRPWLQGTEILTGILDAADRKLYSNSVPDLLALTIADHWLDPGQVDLDAARETARTWMKNCVRLIFLVYLAWECRGLWRAGGAAPRATADAIITASARAFLVLILVVLFWVLEWYYLWPLALVTVLGWDRMLTKVVVGYTLTSLPVFYLHHYWSVHMPGGFVLLYAFPPLLLPVVGWGIAWVRRRRPGPGVARGSGLERLEPA